MLWAQEVVMPKTRVGYTVVLQLRAGACHNGLTGASRAARQMLHSYPDVEAVQVLECVRSPNRVTQTVVRTFTREKVE
jgi:hypothetical protein